MKQGEAKLLLNCPKCHSGRLGFVKSTNKSATPVAGSAYVECLCCKHSKGVHWATLHEAVADWNER